MIERESRQQETKTYEGGRTTPSKIAYRMFLRAARLSFDIALAASFAIFALHFCTAFLHVHLFPFL